MSTRTERINAAVATVGLAAVLLVAPLSPLLRAAVALTMVGTALAFRLTANPVHVVSAREPAPRRRR